MKYIRSFRFLVLFILIKTGYIQAQVGIGTTNPNSSALLHLESQDKGFLPPVMDNKAMTDIINPIEGLTVYCADCSPIGYHVYTSGNWTALDNNSSLGLVNENGNVHGNLNNFDSTVADEGTHNLALGIEALNVLQTGSYNMAIGEKALEYTSSGTHNTGVGHSALRKVVTGTHNTAVGFYAGTGVGIGSRNVFLGSFAGFVESGDDKLCIENYITRSPLIGGDFSGDRVGINRHMDSLSTGATLQVEGSISLQNGADIYGFSTDGTLVNNSDTLVPTQKAVKDYVDNNTSNGLLEDASYNIYGNNYNFTTSLTSSSKNTAIGYQAHRYITTSSENVSIGYQALSSGWTTQQTIAIGVEAGLNGASNGVFLGYKAGKFELASNKLYIENSDSDTPLIGGDFSADKVGINMSLTDLAANSETFQVGGTASNASGGSWLANSDRRLKANIQYLKAEEMLNKMLQLQGASYEWNDTVTAYASNRPEGTQYGFIAQDIEKVWPSKISKDGQGYLMTSYGDYDPMFVESIRALNNKIGELEKYVELLEKDKKRLSILESNMSQLKAENQKLKEDKNLQMSELLERLGKLEATVQ